MNNDSKIIYKIISKMLDNPDQTTTALEELEEYMNCIRLEAIGCMYAEACGMLDENIDLRTAEASSIFHKVLNDLLENQSKEEKEKMDEMDKLNLDKIKKVLLSELTNQNLVVFHESASKYPTLYIRFIKNKLDIRLLRNPPIDFDLSSETETFIDIAIKSTDLDKPYNDALKSEGWNESDYYISCSNHHIEDKINYWTNLVYDFIKIISD